MIEGVTIGAGGGRAPSSYEEITDVLMNLKYGPSIAPMATVLPCRRIVCRLRTIPSRTERDQRQRQCGGGIRLRRPMATVRAGVGLAVSKPSGVPVH